MDWRGDPEIKSTFWPYKGTKFSLLHSHDSSHLFVSTVPWELRPFSDLSRTPDMYMMHPHTCRQNTQIYIHIHTYRNKIDLFFKKVSKFYHSGI